MHRVIAACATVAAVCLLPACTSGRHHTAAPGGVERPRSPSPASARANERAAGREAGRLLSLAAVPPGAVRTAAHPSALSGPALGLPMVDSLVDRTAFWRVTMSFDATLAWLRAHPPRGLSHQGRSSASGPTYRSAGDSYVEPDRPGITGAALDIGVEPVDSHTTAIRADGIVEWLDPTPYRDSASGKRMRLTVTDSCPREDRQVVGVRNSGTDLSRALVPGTSPTEALVCVYWGMNGHAFTLGRQFRLGPAAAGRLAGAARQVPLSHVDGGTTSCPMSDGAAMAAALSYPGRPDIDLWFTRNGCQSVSNGAITAAADGFAAAVSRYSDAVPLPGAAAQPSR